MCVCLFVCMPRAQNVLGIRIIKFCRSNLVSTLETEISLERPRSRSKSRLIKKNQPKLHFLDRILRGIFRKKTSSYFTENFFRMILEQLETHVRKIPYRFHPTFRKSRLFWVVRAKTCRNLDFRLWFTESSQSIQIGLHMVRFLI